MPIRVFDMKTKKRGEEYISCLAQNFDQPIAVLVERLLKVELPDPPDDPPRESEVDYAISLVVLLVLQFEAWISRARNFDENAYNKADKRDALKWMTSINNPKLASIINDLTEVYFLRDAIVHNHIWLYTLKTIQGKARYSNFSLDLTWQSTPRKFNCVIRGKPPLQSFPRTKRLNLMLVPSFIGRREVAAVFKTVKDALKIIDELGYVKTVPKVPYVRFDGKLSFPFWSLIGRIQKSFLTQKK